MQERAWIATTNQGTLILLGKQAGRMYLIGTAAAKSGLGDIQTTQHTITFSYETITISGVYFPP